MFPLPTLNCLGAAHDNRLPARPVDPDQLPSRLRTPQSLRQQPRHGHGHQRHQPPQPFPGGRRGDLAVRLRLPDLQGGLSLCGAALRPYDVGGVQQSAEAHLDHREKNGYLRLHTSLHLAGGGTVAGLFYVADADNPAFLGPAPAADIARQIAAARGPSGANLDYLLELAAGLRALGTRDPHIEQLLAEVSAGA